MNNACIIGNGVVGGATAKLLGIKKTFDLNPDKCTINLEEAGSCRFVFICLPTPVGLDGKYELQPIINIIKQIDSYGHAPIFIIRSTVFPGFARHIMEETGVTIISNPEFLSEDTADKDSKNPPFILLGGEPGVFIEEVKALYRSRIKYHEFIVTNNTSAELAKLAMNAYFSTKVIFANQLYDTCRDLGANYERVKEVLESHPFGPKNHFTIWYKGKRGINGKCLPKDTIAFSTYANSDLVNQVLTLNQQYIGQHE